MPISPAFFRTSAFAIALVDNNTGQLAQIVAVSNGAGRSAFAHKPTAKKLMHPRCVLHDLVKKGTQRAKAHRVRVKTGRARIF